MSTYYHYLPEPVQHELRCIAETLLTPGKGILTADESIATIGKRLQEQGMNNDEDTRRKWRLLLFSTNEIEKYISGVILTNETLHQKDDAGKLLVDHLKDRCIIPGIKIDSGLVSMPGSENEVFTQGMDDLGIRLADYKQKGCEFARWRCVFKIGPNTPSHRAILSNAEGIARFASICQSQSVCPLIEPEVLSEGNHDIQRCERVTETVLSFVFRALSEHQIFLEGIVLKPNMVTTGMQQSAGSNPDVVGKATVIALQRTVPPAVPGVAFSSGGQTEEEATTNLQEIVCSASGEKPWYLTFAFGRALQASAMRVWKGSASNLVAAQTEFLKRAKTNGDATCGFINESDSNSEIFSQTFPISSNKRQSETTGSESETVKSDTIPAHIQDRERHNSTDDGDEEGDTIKPIASTASKEIPLPKSTHKTPPKTPTTSPTDIFQRYETNIPDKTSSISNDENASPSSPKHSLSDGRKSPGVGISRRVAPTYNPDPNPHVLGHKFELLAKWKDAKFNKSIVAYKSYMPQPCKFGSGSLKDFQTVKDMRISDSVRLPVKLTLSTESKTPTIVEEVAITSNCSKISGK